MRAAPSTWRADQLNQWRQRCGAGADPVGQRRHVEIDALAGEALALPVQRQVIAELAVEDHRQQPGTGPAAGDRVERRRRLGDGLARPAGELLPHGLDHLPLARDHFERLGDVLAQLDELAAAARAGARRRDDDPLARQMRRQRGAYRLLAFEALDRDRGSLRGGGFGGQFVLGRRRFQLLELELQLIEMAGALGGLPELVALVLGDHQLEMSDHRLGARRPGLGQLARRALGRERRLQRFDVVGNRIRERRHATNGIIPDSIRAS